MNSLILPINPQTYVLYHANCTDGSGAAAAAWLHFGEEVKYIAVQYGSQPPEDIADGSDVYILDFSYPRPVLEGLRARLNCLVVLDHHKTARDDLAGLDYAQFDMDRCGTSMAWAFFHPDKPVPDLVEYIEDRDLWKKKMQYGREVSAALGVIEDFREIAELFARNVVFPLIKEGEGILRVYDQAIKNAVKNAVVAKWPGTELRCGVANVTLGKIISDTGEAIYKHHDVDFSVTYFVTHDKETGAGKMVFSFRSMIEHCDVSEIAKRLGGGGHAAACGAGVPFIEGAILVDKMLTGAEPLSKYKLEKE